jgi:Dyp-type peroxidase family
LRGLFAEQNAVSELSSYDGVNLPGSVAHFGYRDGFAQPNVEGAPRTGGPDPLPVAPAGAFLLGYESQNPGLTYEVPVPNDLGFNGSFLAYRILQQDCAGFEQFLQDSAPKVGMSAEKLAAKLCGRWRNGVPLALSPDTDTPEVPIPLEEMNNFDYVPTATYPDGYNDAKGLRCPLGSHVRRANPRSSRIAGGGGNIHRLMRRGLPYGPPYDPENPHDGIERGLLGIFICVSLRDQFEFLMADWIENGVFAPGLGADKDPLLGNNNPESSRFVIPTENGPQHITGFSQFITTRGGAYCFLPGITALKYIANLQ